MSILRTHNLQNPDSSSINIVMDQGGNTNITGVTTVGSNFHVTDGISRIGALTEYGTKTVSNKGLIISSSGENTLKLIDTTSYATNVGASILLGGQYRASGDAQEFVKLKSFKENSTNGNYAYGFSISTNANGGVVTERLRIKSDGDVYIGNIAHSNDGGANSSYRTLTLTDTTNGAQLHLRGQSPKLFLDVTSGGNGEIYYDSGDLRILSGEPGGTPSEKLRISSNGSVGIGTNNPGERLHLTTASGNCKLRIDAASAASVDFYNSGTRFSDMFTDASTGNFTITNRQNADIIVRTNGTNERLRITSGGQVQVSNTVSNNDAAVNIYKQTGDNSDKAIFRVGYDAAAAFEIYRIRNNGDIFAGPNQSGSDFIFQNVPTGGSITERLRITSSGSVGIGTVNPGSKLTVYETGGNAKLQLQRANTANNTDDYGSVLWRSAGGTAVGGINVARATAENDGYMFFQTTSGGTMSEKMRIQPSGYIGIGEVAPGGRLTVKHANTSTSGLNATLKLKQGVATNGNRSSLIFSSLDDFDVAAVNGVVDTHSGTAANNVGHLEFWTKETGNATAQERMRVHPTGQVSINSNGYMGRFHIQQDALTEPALCIRHHDASLYKHMGTAGPNDRNGNNASNGGQYLHVRVRTVWNDSSMTMFRITGYYPYHDYTHSFVGMYRYGHNSYRTNPYGQTVHNLKRATIHSIYNEAASPGYLVFVCDWGTNYTGLMFEHIGAGTDYGSYMQNDIEIIDSLRSTGTSALTF